MKEAVKMLKDAVLWKFLSLLLRIPRSESVKQARDLIKELPPGLQSEAALLITQMAKPETEARYHLLLGSGGIVSPYESDYRGSGCDGMREKGVLLGDVAAFYRAFGFDFSKDMLEAPDHVAVELAFISYLKLKEAYAMTNRGEAVRRTCLEAQGKFLEDHLLDWLPQLLETIDRKAEDDFYTRASQFIRRVLADKQADKAESLSTP